MAVGITGSRRISYTHHAIVAEVLDSLPFATRLVTGGAVGVDALVAALAAERGLLVHTVLPANFAEVDPRWQQHADSYETMASGTSYRDRNVRLVALSRRLLAFPLRPEQDARSRRSGSWMTIRLARQAGIPVEIHVLDPVAEDV